jgi:hypothetical protein
LCLYRCFVVQEEVGRADLVRPQDGGHHQHVIVDAEHGQRLAVAERGFPSDLSGLGLSRQHSLPRSDSWSLPGGCWHLPGAGRKFTNGALLTNVKLRLCVSEAAVLPPSCTRIRGQAYVIARAETLSELGDTNAARESYRDALGILEALHDPRALDIQAHIATLNACLQSRDDQTT